MAGNYTDLADLIEKNEAAALDQLKNESSAKQTAKHDDANDDRNGGRDHRGRNGHSQRNSQTRYLDERAENDERRVRRSKDLSDDDAGRGISDKESANGSTRDRRHRRSQSPARSDRRSYRDRDREYGSRGDLRDSYRPGDRRGDRRGDDDTYRPDGDRRRRDRDREYEGRDRDRDRSRDRHDRRHGRDGRDSRRHRSPTPPNADANDRDERTVFVQQIAASCSSSKLHKFFEQIGPVVDAQIVKDRVSGRSKGVGYVEFREKESVEKALGLTGQQINGVPIIVQQTEAEKNRQPRNTTGGQTPANGAPFHRLYVGNIHFSVTEDDLRSIFGPFGNLEFVQIQKEETTGRSRGYGFVQYSDPGCAKQALEKLNGFELAKRPIRVGLGNDRFTDSSTKSLLQASQQQFQGSEFSGAGGRGAYAGGTGNFDRAAREADKAGAGSALDDSDVGGVNMSNYNRYELIRKLARVDNDEVKAPVQAVASKPVDHPQTATRCIVLRHLYDPATMTEASEQKELEDDVLEECKAQYGEVVHIGLNLDSSEGEVYLKFKDLQGSKNAIQGLNGRYFGGSRITAAYIVDAIYNTNFPKAANV